MVGRFRDNDELKHTLRSAYKFGKNVVRKIHISIADVIEEELWNIWRSEQHQANQEQQRKQVQGNGEATPAPEEEAPQLFKRGRQYFDSWMEFAQKHGVNRTVVTSMEEGYKYIVADEEPPFIYMNDDEYFGRELAQSDFWTPHYGLVFQMNPAILFAPRPCNYNNNDPLNRGYIDNLQFTNCILSKRFGYRFRPSLDHIVQVGSRTIIEEIEVDSHSNGDLEWEERWALVSLVEDWNASGGGVNRERTGQVVNHTPQFLSGFRQVLEQTGYGDTQEEPATRYVFSGMEGFPFMIPEVSTSKTIYKLDGSEAMAMQKLNNDFSVMPSDRTAEDTTDNNSENADNSGNSDTSQSTNDTVNTDNTKEAHNRGISAIPPDPSRHSSARLRIIKDLYKYNFVIGESDSYFVTLIGLEKAQGDMAFLDKVKEHDRKLHIVCLNDGIVERNGTEVRALLTHFLEDRYGDPAPWEKVVAVVDS
ncbi:hypothetical protein BGZ96_005977 [Linnemannia gamsii]|uniref:Stealth protein CR4 conserved region 4 domain-containing protein n=1 Tax=Linnemannia gamsii TaxID=64522 RepID=A0ABQ7K5L3_9FUNG|nr:hypothetical protein BGZ96_005977 [Linnemannia gamsii]